MEGKFEELQKKAEEYKAVSAKAKEIRGERIAKENELKEYQKEEAVIE